MGWHWAQPPSDHLFWSKRLREQVDLNDRTNFSKRAIKDLFHDRWREGWKHLTTSWQTKYWIGDPGSIGDATAHQDNLMLNIALHALTDHNYLNYYHHTVLAVSNCIGHDGTSYAVLKGAEVEFWWGTCRCDTGTQCWVHRVNVKAAHFGARVLKRETIRGGPCHTDEKLGFFRG